MKKVLVHLAQVLIILIPIGIFFWLLNNVLVPSGYFVVEKGVGQISPYIDRLLPDARVEPPYQETDKTWGQKIVGDPVFFFVHPPRGFEEVTAEIRFRNSGVPIVEFGLLAEALTGAYTLEPLQNLTIDNCNWFRLENDGVIFLQRNKEFSTVDDFLSAQLPRSTIATYHYNLASPYRLIDYQPTTKEQKIDVSLRGSQEFYTYIKNESLRFVVGFMDMNRQVGEEVVSLVVINEAGQPVAEVRAQDDGDTAADDKSSGWRELTLATDNLPEGVYKVQLKGNEDIFFRSLITPQQKITFLNQVWLADEVGYRDGDRSLTLWTEGKNLKFVTRHATGRQTIKIGSGSLEVAEPYQEYKYQVNQAGLLSLVVAKTEDLLIRTNGYFSFSPEQYFNPNPIRLTAETSLESAGINYIIAKYTPPRWEDGWWVAKADFDVRNAAFDNKTWKFVFSVPTVEEEGQEFIVSSIKMEFLSQPLNFKEIVKKFWEYVQNKSKN